MSPKLALAALLLVSLPLLGLADDSSTDDSGVAVEKKSDGQSSKSKRDSSDITLSRADRLAERDERHRSRKEQRRSYKDRGKGGRNPSPDD